MTRIAVHAIVSGRCGQGGARVSHDSLASVVAFRELQARISEQLDVVLTDSRTPEEAAQGMRFLLRVLAMSTEVVGDGNPRAPFFAQVGHACP